MEERILRHAPEQVVATLHGTVEEHRIGLDTTLRHGLLIFQLIEVVVLALLLCRGGDTAERHQ